MANLVPKVNNTGSLGTSAKKWSDVHTTTLSVGAQASALSLNSQKITNLATPTVGTDAATKSYVDDAVQGLSAKDSVRVATTANGTLASAFANGQTVDGVTLATGDRVLLKNQTAGAENGIYTVNASGAPTRAVDFDANAEVAKGAFIFVEEGTSNANAGFVLTTDGAITLGTTALAFTQFSGAGQITAGDGIAKSGNTLSVDIPGSDEMTGDVVDTDELLISDGGVLKRADFSVVRDAVFNDISGDATVAAGGALSLASAAITGLTAKGSIADNDLILIADSGASNALKKMTKATFVAGLGGGGASNLNGLSDVTISSAANSQILVYDGSDSFDNVAMSGDATIASSGALTIAADAVTYAKMQNVSATDKILGRSTSGAGIVEEITCTSAGRALLDDANATAQRTTLGLGSAATLSVGIANTNVLQANTNVVDNDFLRIDGTTVEGRSASEVLSDIGAQASDAGLTSIAGLTTAANKMLYATASDTYAVADLTAAGRALLDDADAAAQRTTLGLVIGTNVQAYDADLAAIAGLTSAADKGIQFTGSGTATTYDLTAAGKALLDDANAAAQRTTLGLGTSDNPAFAGSTSGNIQVGVTGDNEIDTSSGNLTIDSAGGTVTVDDNLTVSGNTSIVGNLTVSGTTTTLNSEVALADRFMLLNSNSTANTAVDGGLVINVDPSATTYSGASINIAFASATTVEIAGNATAELAANKIFIVRQAEDAANNGLYQIHSSSHSGGTTTITIKDASTNTPSSAVSGIVNTAFTTNADDDTVVIAKTKIAVLKSDTANNVFEVGFGDDGSSLSYTDLATAGGGITGLSTNASDTLTIGANYNLIPNTAGSTDLGSASAELGHIFIADDKKIQFGDGQDSTIEYDEDGDNVLQIAGANVRIGHGAATQLQFRDSAVHLSSDADGYLNAQADTGITLNVNGTDELALTSSAATFGGNLVIPNGGNIGSVGDTDALAISATGLVTVSSTSDATSSSTGALRVSGGLGVAKDLFVGDDVKGFASLVAPHASTKTITVTVAAKSAAHRYNGTGSSSGYKLDGVESPFLTLTPGRTYKFDQADSSNSGHPLRFYYDAAKVTAYTTGVTASGTPGSSGAYTQIVVSDTTPSILHYQCSAHAHMGNSVSASSSAATRLDLAGTVVTATGAELNILDGVTATTAELNLLDGATAASTSTTILDTDRVIVNDGGTMKQLAFSDVKSYIGSPTATDLTKTNGNITIDAQQNDSDIIFKGTDNNSDTTFLTLDGSEGGAATFNAGITAQSLSLGDFQLSVGGGTTTQYMKLGMTADESNNEPIFLIENTTTSALGGKLAFSIREANSNAVGNGDTLGTIDWRETQSNGSVATWCSQTGRVGDHTSNYGIIDLKVRSGSTSATTGLEVGGSAGGTYVDIKNHDGSDSGLKLNGTLVTASAVELNKLDGVTATTAELNILDGVTATTAELNLLDGGTSATSTTLVNSDRVIVNDTGTMKQVALSDVKTFTNPDIDEIGAGNSDTVLTTFGEIQINSTKNGESIIFNGKNNGGGALQLLALHGQDATYGQGFVDIFGDVRSGTLLPKNSFANLGSASLRWGDAYFKEYSKLHFGTDQEITLEHDPDDGLILKMTGSSNNDPSFVLISDNANTAGARLQLRQDSASPANGDTVGKIEFYGNDSAGNTTNYGQITGHAAAVASGSEVGKITISPYPAISNTKGISVEGINGSTSKVKVNIDTHNGTDSGLHLNHTLVTASAAELNILDGVTATAAELNLLDGGTSATSTTLVDADRVIVNDNGTMKQVALSDVKTYVNAGGGGGGSQLPPEVKTVSTTATLSLTPSNASTYNAIEVIYTATGSSAYTVALPTAASIEGKKIHVKRLATANITVDGHSSETIDGSATFVLTSQYSSVTLISDGTNWIII